VGGSSYLLVRAYVNLRPGPDNANTRAQEAAFQHPDVVRIAQLVVAAGDLTLLKLASIAIIHPFPAVAADLIALVRLTPGTEGRARRIAAAGLRISREPDEDARVRRRGALVERIVWEQVSGRDASAQRERCVELSSNRWSRAAWSKPKEIVAARPDECEVYECKLTPSSFDQDDLDELADIRDTAAGEGLTPFATLATLESFTTFRSSLRRRTHGPLHYVTDVEVLTLGRGVPAKTITI
jgi:hypothetical protein